MMNRLTEELQNLDAAFISARRHDYDTPTFLPQRHYLELASAPYFRALLVLRHGLKRALSWHFSRVYGATEVDLFMVTTSVSSPMGSGSNSLPLPFVFGQEQAYLTDSSQFGFEPLLMNGFNMVYCYMPSMRGEEPDARHLNQFFHCEAECVGSMNDVMRIVEEVIRTLAQAILAMPNLIRLLSEDEEATRRALNAIVASKQFDRLTFDKAMQSLQSHDVDLTAQQERDLLRLVSPMMPLWVTGYHRDRTPFYLRPDTANVDRVINADLLFPALTPEGFFGEVVGSGERQCSSDELYLSLRRQSVDPTPYEWYIDLRRQPNYRVTSGFGLGIERFIAWTFGKHNIRDVIIYPRMKGVLTLP